MQNDNVVNNRFDVPAAKFYRERQRKFMPKIPGQYIDKILTYVVYFVQYFLKFRGVFHLATLF